VATLNRAANEALHNDDVRKRFATVASEPIGGSPSDLATMITTDRAVWERNIKALGLKAN
jgi:tripartite-type tricarboxylate transporter receptor subunit TctC